MIAWLSYYCLVDAIRSAGVIVLVAARARTVFHDRIGGDETLASHEKRRNLPK
jgi:hypothetical protein